MRPSVEKSLLLALGLAVCASSLDGVRGRGPMAHPAAERLRAAATAPAGIAAGPRLVLLPPVSVPATGWSPRTPRAAAVLASAVRTAGPAATAAARRDEFLRRARQLVGTAAAAGLPAR